MNTHRLVKIAMRLIVLLVVWSFAGSFSSFAQDGSLESYEQTLTIRFRDRASAERASVAVESLFDGHHRAVSCRWDDNWTSDNPGTRDLMEEYGIRGTWYLNDREFSPENRPADYLPVAKELLRGGNSVGGHSLTHPFITYFHSNRMFAEMSGVRIAWESVLDKPVSSYAYSFVDLSPGPEYQVVLQRSLKSLSRSGFDHVAEYINFFENVEMDLELSPIMPPENNPFEAFRTAVEWAYHDKGLTEKHPMITNSMHAWYDTPRLNYSYDELRKRFELLTSLDDVWHCNQNEYAGYRRQFHQAVVEELKREDATVTFTLTRPSTRAINDDTPLTLAISGVPPQAILSIECADSKVIVSERKGEERTRFHVFHRDQDRLPKAIGHIANPDNQVDVSELDRDPDFPQIVAGLHVGEQSLNLELFHEGGRELEEVRVAWRVPIGYSVDNEVQSFGRIPACPASLETPLAATSVTDARWGREHFAAQVDFRVDGEPGRLHLTCQREGESPNDSLPGNGFSLLGPVAVQSVDESELVELAESHWSKNRWSDDGWRLSDGSSLSWRVNARDGYINQDWLNPEYVRTMGTWDAVSPTYLLRSAVWCPEKRRARITISHPTVAKVFVNGRQLSSDEFDLEGGENRVLIVYPGCTLGVGTQRLSACFVRLSDPGNGQRYQDLRYQAF